jgi:hypothetical protein
MRLHDLQDKLRAHIRARIDRGELTGTGLSHEAGFQQGHLSNFLTPAGVSAWNPWTACWRP